MEKPPLIVLLVPLVVSLTYGLFFCNLVEHLKPIRKVDWKRHFRFDLLAYFVNAFSFLAVNFLFRESQSSLGFFDLHLLQGLHPVVQFVVFMLVVDFGRYWTHRFLHTSIAWRAHAVHHSGQEFYWFAGAKSSIPHNLILHTTPVAVGTILLHPDQLVFQVFVACSFLHAVWEHSNIGIFIPIWNHVVVEPRYHFVHHCVDMKYSMKNFGCLLKIWDRMFGTHFDPKDLPADVKIGIEPSYYERKNLPRLFAGI